VSRTALTGTGLVGHAVAPSSVIGSRAASLLVFDRRDVAEAGVFRQAVPCLARVASATDPSDSEIVSSSGRPGPVGRVLASARRVTKRKSHRSGVRPADKADSPRDPRADTPGSAFKAVKKVGRPAKAMNRR
jgi:hypothetical protein